MCLINRGGAGYFIIAEEEEKELALPFQSTIFHGWFKHKLKVIMGRPFNKVSFTSDNE